MERWAGRVAVVTGASSGIGAAIAAELTKKGLKVVGLARRVERVQELSKSLETATGKLHAVKCDVGNEADVLAAFKWVKNNLGGVDILINNAAVGHDTSLIEWCVFSKEQTYRRHKDLSQSQCRAVEGVGLPPVALWD
ncbi:hypothetical protein Cfor_12655 [Coptotermes formosanus]|uniref:Dehydrogenase/reductase SDR family member 11 n=1 Tax=Coptotermes formosanus TaxID=36987 RepID=A0A6L2PFG4_COPFO|nr:hypothetical protein Cfor_12655 [Coptotermes formosanus]